jgi:hypothetical protein
MYRRTLISNVMNDLICKDTISNISWYTDFDDKLLSNSAVGYLTIGLTYDEVTPCSRL